MAVGLTPGRLGLGLQNLLAVDQQPVPPAQAKPTFFQEGGMGRHLAGAIGDALLNYGGMQPVYAPMQQQQRQQAQEEAQWGRRRQQTNEDWMQRQKYEDAHRQPTAFEDNAGNRWVTDPATGENRMVFVDRAPKQIMQDGMMISVPNPYNVGQPAVAPVITEDLWNKGTPIGGSTPSASGNFPRSR